jgi:Flp pilus assembly protein TadG
MRPRIPFRCSRVLRSLHADETGSSLVEVACVMPLMLLILVGAVDFGQAYYVGIEINSAASAGTAYGVTNFVDTVGMQKAAQLDAVDVPSMTATATWGCECSDGTGASANCLAIPSCPTNLVEYVDVVTSVDFKPVLAYPMIPSLLTIKGHSRMRVVL